MPISRNTGALVGTNESTLQNIAAATTHTGTEVDVLADNVSVGDMWLYLVVTATAVSSVDIRVNSRRISGQAYQHDAYQINVPTISGTKRVPLGKRPASRYMTADVRNNDASNAVSVFVGYELEKLS